MLGKLTPHNAGHHRGIHFFICSIKLPPNISNGGARAEQLYVEKLQIFFE